MGTPVHPWRAPLLVLAMLLPSFGCKTFMRVFTPQPQHETPPYAVLDQPPPRPMGELSVASVSPVSAGSPAGGPSGQGAAASSRSHGDPLAGGIAAAIGLVVVGATVTKTVAACAQPGASPSCLRGPGPSDSATDAGAPSPSPER